MNITCPHCNGDKRVFAFQNNGPDSSTHTSGFVDCRTCSGTGCIDDAHNQRIIDGKAIRASRLNDKESLYDAAKRMGLSAVELSAIERGRVAPTPLKTEQ